MPDHHRDAGPWLALAACFLALGPTASPAQPDDADAARQVTITAPTGNGLVVKHLEVGPLGDLPLLQTPFSVNVIPRSLLDTQRATTYGDFLKNDPSTNFCDVPVGFTTLRGFPVGTAGYLYDGLPGNAGLSDGRGQIEAIERIDILKGPNALLYGLGASTSLGGTLNYVPLEPLDAQGVEPGGQAPAAEPLTVKATARVHF